MILSGTSFTKVSSTVVEGEPGELRIGSHLTCVTCWSARASRISSSASLIGIPKITPTLLAVDRVGRVLDAGLPAGVLMLSSTCCCCKSVGLTDRSPPGSTVESRGSPMAVQMAFRMASRSAKDIDLKFGRSSMSLIITGRGWSVELHGLFERGGASRSAILLVAPGAEIALTRGPVGGSRVFDCWNKAGGVYTVST